jgi:hypothetical protein
MRGADENFWNYVENTRAETEGIRFCEGGCG